MYFTEWLRGNEQQIVNFVNEDGSAVMIGENTATTIIDGESAYVTEARDGFLVSSYEVNLPEGYNSESGYEYSMADLITRHKIEGGIFGNIVSGLEASGNAAPIARKDAYREYVNKWGTDKAFWYGIEGGYFGQLLPGPREILSDGQRALSNATKNPSFNPNYSKVKSPIKNSWNRFQHANKGSGKSKQQLREEYNKLMKGK